MSDYRQNWYAPRFLLQKGVGNYTPAIGRLFKDLGAAVVAGVRASHDSLAPTGRDLIGPVSNMSSSNSQGPKGEAYGRAQGFPSWADFPIPRALNTNAPFSAFCFHVPRATTDGMVLINYGGGSGAGATGWGLLHSGTSGVVTMLSWGLAGWSSSVPTAPIYTPQCCGIAYNGADLRFFTQGRFSTTAGITAPRAFTGNLILASRADHINNIYTGSIHVAYVWNRAITDGEFMTLWRDPWAIMRPNVPWLLGAAAGGGGGGSRILIPAFL